MKLDDNKRSINSRAAQDKIHALFQSYPRPGDIMNFVLATQDGRLPL